MICIGSNYIYEQDVYLFINLASEVAGVRLIGDSPGAGRLEVNIDGYWSTVCDDGWSTNWKLMWFVLKQLGFTRAINYTTGSTTMLICLVL